MLVVSIVSPLVTRPSKSSILAAFHLTKNKTATVPPHQGPAPVSLTVQFA